MRVTSAIGVIAVWVSACDAIPPPSSTGPSSAPAAPSSAAPRVYEGRRAGQWPSIVVPAGERIRSTGEDPGGTAVTDATTLTVGQTVHLNWHGGWTESRVLRVIDAGTVRVHLVGYPPARDSDVPVSQLRVGAVITDAMAQTHYRSGT